LDHLEEEKKEEGSLDQTKDVIDETVEDESTEPYYKLAIPMFP
jgi:hypothetical protein